MPPELEHTTQGERGSELSRTCRQGSGVKGWAYGAKGCQLGTRLQWAFCCFLTQHAGRLDSVCLCSGSGWWDCPRSLIREKPDVPSVLPGRTEGRGRRHEMPKSRFSETHLVLAFPSPTPGRKVSPNCGRGCSHWVECSIGPSPSAYKIGQARPRLVQTTDTSFEFPERVFSFDNFEWGHLPFLAAGLALATLGSPHCIPHDTIQMAPHALFTFLTLGLGVVSEAQHPIMHGPISASPSHPPATSASALRTTSEKKWLVAFRWLTFMLRRSISVTTGS